MHKIDGAGHVDGQFVTEDAANGRPPTLVTAEWLNAVQGELVAVLQAAGIAPDKANNAQLSAAIGVLLQRHKQEDDPHPGYLRGTDFEAWKATQTLTGYTVSGAPDDSGSWERIFSFRHRVPIQVTFSTLGGYYAPGTIVMHIMVDYIGRFFLSVQSKLGAQIMTKCRITTDNTDNGPTFFEGFLPHIRGQSHPVTTQALGPNLPDVQFNGGGINLPPLSHLSGEVTL